jgi:uncharacterized protein YcbK (DUF882 family)
VRAKFSFSAVLALAIALASTSAAGADPVAHDAEKTPVKTARKHHVAAAFQGHNADKSTLRKAPLDKPSGHIVLRAENLGEQVEVDIYKPDGQFDYGALAQLDELFRDTKIGEVRAVRAELYEQLSRIQDHFGGKLVYLVSGFRFAERDSSRHYHASAMDIHIPGVSTTELYRFAQTLDTGGMGIGIYPTSAFVHVDYRAPGEPSYRWVDTSGHGGSKSTGRTQPARKPTS